MHSGLNCYSVTVVVDMKIAYYIRTFICCNVPLYEKFGVFFYLLSCHNSNDKARVEYMLRPTFWKRGLIAGNLVILV